LSFNILSIVVLDFLFADLFFGAVLALWHWWTKCCRSGKEHV